MDPVLGTLRALMIVHPLTNRPPHQILPHTNSYFTGCLDLPKGGPGAPQGGKAPLAPQELLEKA